jgi:hypothetical protein
MMAKVDARHETMMARMDSQLEKMDTMVLGGQSRKVGGCSGAAGRP